MHQHPNRPSNHTTRNWSWYQRKPASVGPVSRPAPLTGANTQPLNTQQRPVDDQRRPENINQVANNNNNNNNNNPNNNNNAGPSR